MSRQSDKARAAWHDRYRAALVQACGTAAILGYKDHAATLCELIDAARVDSRAKTCYTGTKQRQKAQKAEEEKTMEKIEIQRQNGISRDGEKACIWASTTPRCATSTSGDGEEADLFEALYTEYVLDPVEDFEAGSDEPTEEADERAAEYLRKEITAKARALGIAPEMLAFRF